MGSFTLPTYNNLNPPTPFDLPQEYYLCPYSGTTLRMSWTCPSLMSFTVQFKNVSNGGLIGSQTFTNNTSGNCFVSSDPNFNASATSAGTPWTLHFSITGHATNANFAVSFSVDNGRPYAVVWSSVLGKFVSIHRASDGKFCPVYLASNGHMQHS